MCVGGGWGGREREGKRERKNSVIMLSLELQNLVIWHNQTFILCHIATDLFAVYMFLLVTGRPKVNVEPLESGLHVVVSNLICRYW